MFFIDSHAHLNMLSATDDLKAVIARAKESNVKYIQTICTKLNEFSGLLEITEKYDNVFTSLGVHPSEVKNHDPFTKDELINLSVHPKVIGLGETGLDYYYEHSEKNLQINAFAEHILASQETCLPLIVHTRDAEADTFDIINNHLRTKHLSGLIHCFTASKEFAKKMLDLGFYISFSGIITFKNAGLLREVVKFVPLDKILIETDSPYLAPVPMRGKTNEPAYVTYVANEIAGIKSVNVEEVARITSTNFFQLFSKGKEQDAQYLIDFLKKDK